MNRQITFRAVDMDWREGLPLGNGCFGSVSWFEKNTLTASFNHYDVYYHPISRPPGDWNPDEYAALRAKACTASSDAPYQAALYGSFAPAAAPGVNLPGAGEVRYVLGPDYLAETRALTLDIPSASLRFSAQGPNGTLDCTSRILREIPVSVTEFTRSGEFGLSGLWLCYPAFRPRRESRVTFSQPNPRCFIMEVTLPDTPKAGGRDFRFSHILYLEGAEAVLEPRENEAFLRLTAAGPAFRIYSGVFTALRPETGPEAGLSILRDTAAALPKRLAEHSAFWQTCLARAAVSLPDPFLEILWYFDLYLFQCSCGTGGVYAKQASGLHALWDIRKPTQWQSAWYWDVNIQASYWPFFTANHLELARAFCEGFLEHTADIARYTREFCRAPGLAVDYPHPFYNCIGPWCCQFLWWYYIYTNDLEFLKRAYPVFLAEAEYAQSILAWDADARTYSIFPDISPEQGPVTRDSTITLACLRYLLRFTLEAGEILGEDRAVLDPLRQILDRLPDYRTAATTEFGAILCDSALAPAGMALRHPSLLMPIYPIGEWSMDSPEEIRTCMKNTVRYVRERTEYGTFGFGWIACAAARTGDGNLALQTLYDLGLDLHLRANGMPAEETGRWRNFCLVHKPPRYYPAMQEAAGETMAAVNEMVLQCRGKQIHVFPAVPDAWRDCAFDRLLAPGGFQISAARRDGVTVWLRVESLRGNPLRLCLPESLSGSGQPENRRLDTAPGQILTWGTPPVPRTTDAVSAPLCRRSHTGEQIFLGKDAQSAFLSEIDAFLCDKYLANTRIEQQLASLYLFGGQQAAVPAAFSGCRTPFTRLPVPELFSSDTGYGFLSKKGLAPEEEAGALPFDSWFRTDGNTAFCMELPKGQYAFLICGRFSAPATEVLAEAPSFRTAAAAGRKGDQGVLLFLSAGTDCKATIKIERPCRLYGIFLKRI